MPFSIGCCCGGRCNEAACYDSGDQVLFNGNVTASSWLAAIPETVLYVGTNEQLVVKSQTIILYWDDTSASWVNRSALQLEIQLRTGEPLARVGDFTGSARLAISSVATLIVTANWRYLFADLTGTATWMKTSGVELLCTNALPPVYDEPADACISPRLNTAGCSACDNYPEPSVPAYRVTVSGMFPGALVYPCSAYYNRSFVLVNDGGCRWTSSEKQRPFGRDYLCQSVGCLTDAQLVGYSYDRLPRIQLFATPFYNSGLAIIQLQWRVRVRWCTNHCPPIGISGFPFNFYSDITDKFDDRDCLHTQEIGTPGSGPSALIEVLR